MLIGSRPWWQTISLMLAVGIASFIFVRYYKKRSKIILGSKANVLNLGRIFVATLLQVATIATIYGVELQKIGAHASLGQILSYTGAANFSLFVALTPGAIGIRETFLVFSQNLHHLNSSVIVAANILDRAVYLLFLGLLFVLVIALHAKDKLNVRQTQNKTTD
jgi:uncharacterized membrane protein YbhN (UPF0104 family)